MKEKTIEVKNRKTKMIRRLWMSKSKVVIAIVIVLALIVIALGIGSHFNTEGEVTELGFEDIGELATQSARCTSIWVEEKDRDLFGVSIPFTQTKYIYTYDTEIKAGFDFGDIEVDDSNMESTKNITVVLPEIRTLSKKIDLKSFKLYHEEESIFTPISIEEHNKSMTKLEEEAEKTAISNGLYKNAYDNAKELLTAFLGQTYDLETYKLVFSEYEQEEPKDE